MIRISKQKLKDIILEETILVLEQSGWKNTAPSGYFDYLTAKEEEEEEGQRDPSEKELKELKQSAFLDGVKTGILAVEHLLQIKYSEKGQIVPFVKIYGFDNLKRPFGDNCLKGIGVKLVEWQKNKYPSRSDYDEWDSIYGKLKGKPGYENYESERKQYIKRRGGAVLSYRKYRRDESMDFLKMFQDSASRLGLPPLEMDMDWGTIKTPGMNWSVPQTDQDILNLGRTTRFKKEVWLKVNELFLDSFVNAVNSIICYLNDKLEGEWDCGAVCTNV